MPRFYIGQPVICVDDRRNKWVDRRYPSVRWVVLGFRYTIRANMTATMKSGVLNFVTLREVQNPDVVWGDGTIREAAFWEDRFEPATDIGVLEEELAKAKLFVGNKEPQPAPVRRKKKEEV